MTRTPPPKGDRKSQVISARLHPSDPYEKKALEIFEARKAEGWTPRDIITDALLRSEGFSPEMFRSEGRMQSALAELEAKLGALDALEELPSQLTALQHAIEGSIIGLLKDLKRSSPGEFRRFAEHDEDEHGDIELSQDFIKNARRAARRSFSQRREEEDE